MKTWRRDSTLRLNFSISLAMEKPLNFHLHLDLNNLLEFLKYRVIPD